MFEKIRILETIRKNGVNKNLSINEIEKNMLTYINSLDIEPDEGEYEILHTIVLEQKNYPLICPCGSSRFSNSIYRFVLIELLKLPYFKKYDINMFDTLKEELFRYKENNLKLEETLKFLYSRDINKHYQYFTFSPSFFELTKKLLKVFNQENLYDDSVIYGFGLFELLNEIQSQKEKEFYSYEELQKKGCVIPFYKMMYKNADEKDKVIYYIKNNPKALEFFNTVSKLEMTDEVWDSLLHQIKQNSGDKPKIRTKLK